MLRVQVILNLRRRTRLDKTGLSRRVGRCELGNRVRVIMAK